MSSPPMKSPWRCVQKGQTADGEIWIKHIRKVFHFSGKNHSTSLNANEMTTGNRDCTVCNVSSASMPLLKWQAASQVSALLYWVPQSQTWIQEYELCHNLLANSFQCQTKHHVKQKLAQDTDLLDKLTITHCRHLNCYHATWVHPKSSHKNPLARNKNLLHALIRANFAVLWEYLMKLWHDDPVPCWTPPSQFYLCESTFKQEKTSSKFKLHGTSLQMPSTEEFLDTNTIKDERIKVKSYTI